MTRPLVLAVVLLAACSGPSGKPAQSPAVPGYPSTPTGPGQATPPPADSPSPTDPTPSSPPPVTGRLTVTNGEGASGPFQIGAVGALSLSGTCAAAPPGKHTLRFDVLSPNGTVYASVPREVEVPESGAASVQAALPLRGTTVESLMRAGTWNVTLTLDDGEPLASADLDLTR